MASRSGIFEPTVALAKEGDENLGAQGIIPGRGIRWAFDIKTRRLGLF